MTDTIAEIRARHEGADTYWGKTGSVFDGLQAHADRAVLLARVAELEALCQKAGYYYVSGGIYPRGGIMAQELIAAAQTLKETP